MGIFLEMRMTGWRAITSTSRFYHWDWRFDFTPRVTNLSRSETPVSISSNNGLFKKSRGSQEYLWPSQRSVSPTNQENGCQFLAYFPHRCPISLVDFGFMDCIHKFNLIKMRCFSKCLDLFDLFRENLERCEYSLMCLAMIFFSDLTNKPQFLLYENAGAKLRFNTFESSSIVSWRTRSIIFCCERIEANNLSLHASGN